VDSYPSLDATAAVSPNKPLVPQSAHDLLDAAGTTGDGTPLPASALTSSPTTASPPPAPAVTAAPADGGLSTLLAGGSVPSGAPGSAVSTSHRTGWSSGKTGTTDAAAAPDATSTTDDGAASTSTAAASAVAPIPSTGGASGAAVGGTTNANDSPDSGARSATAPGSLPTDPPAPAPAPSQPGANAASAASAASASAQSGDNAMEKAVASQVSRALIQQSPGGDRMLVVRLTPPELGTVRIEVLEHQGTLTAHLHAEDDGVRLAIEHSLPSMREELRAHDAPIRELSLSDPSSGRSFNDGQQQPQRQPSTSGRPSHQDASFSLSNSAPVEVASATAALGGYVDARGVDMRA
jgi:flagellar hook-length control protein FliK